MALLTDLAPVAEQLLNRHLAKCKNWYPHESVPWTLGRDFTESDPWSAEDFPLPDAVRSALFVNLLTEDNLPYYFDTIDRMFGGVGVWREWSHRWVAEEMRHAQVIRDYLLVTRAIEPRALEDGRMTQVSGGVVPEPGSPLDGFAYVALQELATRLSHRNTGLILREVGGDHPAAEAGYDVMARVATDENFHHLFYRDLMTAAIQLDPSGAVQAIRRQVIDFAMPGVGIPQFAQHAAAIARAGVYDMSIHYEQILVPVVLREWDLEGITGLDAEAEAARDDLLAHLSRVGRVAKRLAERAAKNETDRPLVSA
jgi:acyl-[acyl-carrier-protein] desaturase